MSDETTFVILGSCVTRDAFEVLGDRPWRLEKYMARTSLGSFFAKPTRAIQPDFSKFASPFRRRMVEEDVTKTGAGWLDSAEFDVLIYDMIDERFNLARFPDGGICTISAEFEELGISEDAYELVPQESDEFWTRWEDGWTQLVAHLDARGIRDRLVVHDAPWAERIGDSEDDRFQAPYVRKANAWLARAMERIREDIPAGQIVRVADEHRAVDPDHKWGLTPFHYVGSYYADLNVRIEGSVGSRRVPAAENALPWSLVETKFSGRQVLSTPLALRLPQDAEAFDVVIRTSAGPRMPNQAALLALELVATEGQSVEGLLGQRADIVFSPMPGIGWFRYVCTGPGKQTDSCSIRLPEGLTCRGVVIHGWGAGVQDLTLEELRITLHS